MAKKSTKKVVKEKVVKQRFDVKGTIVEAKTPEEAVKLYQKRK